MIDLPFRFTEAELLQLLANGRAAASSADTDPRPVVRLFLPDAAAVWLLAELDPEDLDRAFGLCDPGLGCPELGFVSIAELSALRGPFGRRVERDRSFRPDRPLSAYAAAALAAGRIVI